MKAITGARGRWPAIGLGFALAAFRLAGATVTGSVTEVGPNGTHPNGNIYDQMLMTGTSATVRADGGQIARTSFTDLNGDIVQVEISGAGILTITLEGASGPALAAKYNQPGVLYMKGHAVLELQGVDATTNINVYSVGTRTAVNQGLFRAGELYDGIADIALLRIVADPVNPNGSSFGSIFCGNAHFWRTNGDTGISAQNVHIQNVVRLHDVWAVADATPVLAFGLNSQFGAITIAGGDLAQPNGRPIETPGYNFAFNLTAGSNSHGYALPVQTPRAQRRYGDGRIETVPMPPPSSEFVIVVTPS